MFWYLNIAFGMARRPRRSLEISIGETAVQNKLVTLIGCAISGLFN
jgi:hypothetical protein